MMLTVEDAILNPSCPYVLVPVGRLSHTKGVEVNMPAWGRDGHFRFPNGVRVRMVNKNVWVIADYPSHSQQKALVHADTVVAPAGVVHKANTWQSTPLEVGSYMRHGRTRAASD